MLNDFSRNYQRSIIWKLIKLPEEDNRCLSNGIVALSKALITHVLLTKTKEIDKIICHNRQFHVIAIL